MIDRNLEVTLKVGAKLRHYRAGQVLAISDFEQSPSDGFDELGAEVWCV